VTQVGALLEHLFRESAGQMISTLTRTFGAGHLSLAEEVVQDALVTALRQWSVHGVPEKPAAWLFQVARNRALDHLRRERTLRAKEPEIAAALAEVTIEESGFSHEVADDQIRMMLMCCHPAVPEESRIGLTLKTAGGFSVEEIAAAFLTKSETVAQRIVRAKRLIREERIPMEMPSRAELPGRLESLHQVLYLMFNEGYSAHSGDVLVRSDLCTSTIRLTRIVAEHPAASSPAAHALLSLMLLQAARLPARIDDAGELATLEQQDRSLWDRSMIADGMRHLDASAAGDVITPYHLEAAIAACHAAAPAFEQTDWEGVIELYDQLLSLKASPVVVLNRAIAIAMARGPAADIAAAEEVAAHGSLRDYLPLSSTLGELWLRRGDRQKAAEHFTRALELPATAPEKRFLLRKLQECRT
jgi:RNA polymerase sigma-70 factor (ECF subfamily)